MYQRQEGHMVAEDLSSTCIAGGHDRLVEYHQAASVDGWLLAAVVSQLPTRADGGDPATHVHVSVVAPVRWSYTFETSWRCRLRPPAYRSDRDGPLLHWSYVWEKMVDAGIARDVARRWLDPMTFFLARVLDRPHALASADVVEAHGEADDG